MKLTNVFFSIIFLVALTAFLGCAADETETPAEQAEATAEQGAGGDEAAAGTTSENDDTFYALGLALSRNLQPFNLSDQEFAQVKEGLEDGVFEREPRVEVGEYAQRIQELAQTRGQAAAAENRQASEQFLADAAAEAGARQTDSGLVFQSIEEGTGPSPSPDSVVLVDYEGSLLDGTVFDSSYERGEPVRFPLDQVIPCWSEGAQLMKVGGKAKFICPPDLAYGDRQAGQIPPGSTLIFEVELLEIAEGQ